MKDQTLKKLMREYFDAAHQEDPVLGFDVPSIGLSSEEGCPVTPRTPSWEVVSSPNRYMKTFELGDFTSLATFLKDVFLYQEDTQHHGKITIDVYDVTIEVYTHDVNDITELDQEYVHMIDNIYHDTQYVLEPRGDEYV